MSFNIQVPKNIEHIVNDGSFKLSKVESGFMNMCILTYIDDDIKLVLRFFPRKKLSPSLIDCTLFYKEYIKYKVDSHFRDRVNNVPTSYQLEEFTISKSIDELVVFIRECKFQSIFS